MIKHLLTLLILFDQITLPNHFSLFPHSVIYFFIFLIREGLKNKKINGWIYPSGLAGWGQQGAKIQPKKYCFQKKIQS